MPNSLRYREHLIMLEPLAYDCWEVPKTPKTSIEATLRISKVCLSTEELVKLKKLNNE